MELEAPTLKKIKKFTSQIQWNVVKYDLQTAMKIGCVNRVGQIY